MHDSIPCILLVVLQDCIVMVKVLGHAQEAVLRIICGCKMVVSYSVQVDRDEAMVQVMQAGEKVLKEELELQYDIDTSSDGPPDQEEAFHHRTLYNLQLERIWQLMNIE